MKLADLLFKKAILRHHQEVERQQEEMHRHLMQNARRLRRLELEAGIYKPPLRGDNPDR